MRASVGMQGPPEATLTTRPKSPHTKEGPNPRPKLSTLLGQVMGGDPAARCATLRLEVHDLHKLMDNKPIEESTNCRRARGRNVGALKIGGIRRRPERQTQKPPSDEHMSIRTHQGNPIAAPRLCRIRGNKGSDRPLPSHCQAMGDNTH